MICLIIIIVIIILIVLAIIPKQKITVVTEPSKRDRHCPNCGRTIPIDARTCPYCSKKFW